MDYPFHINPETNRPNKCYNVSNCKFSVSANDHYKTAAEAKTSQTKDTTNFAREHDLKIEKISKEISKVQNRVIRSLAVLAKRLGHRKYNENLGVETILEQADSSPLNETAYKGWAPKDEAIETRKFLLEYETLVAECNELEKAYTGWSRFFLVPGGHIHSSTNCHTCNKSWFRPTQFGWLPELSGKTEANAVKEHGALLCTICFPDAPVEWTDFYEAKAAEKKKTECVGSRTWNYPKETARTGFAGGNYGVCNECGERITITSTGKLTAHKMKS